MIQRNFPVPAWLDLKMFAPQPFEERVSEILAKHEDLRWDDAVRLVLDKTQLDRVRAEKQKAKRESGDFTGAGEDDQ